MSATFAGRLTSDDGRNLRAYFTVDGISDVFQEGFVDVPSTFETSTRARRRCIQTIEIGESSLDVDRRRMVGGSLRVVLIDDDGALDNLFSSRSRRATYATTTHTTSVTTLTVSDTYSLPTSGTVYVGAETITYTNKTATTLTGCTRGVFGSTAQKFYGGTDQGASVFTAPPRWVGRRLRLWAYMLEPDGTTTTSLRQRVDTYRIEEAPAYLGNGQWELRCSHLSDEVAKRKMGTGLREIGVNSGWPGYDAVNDQLIWHTFVTDDTLPTTAGAGYPTYIAFQSKHETGIEGTGIFRFRSAAPTGALGALGFTTKFQTDKVGFLGGRGFSFSAPKKAQHWVILYGGDAGSNALCALTSRLGDSTNGAYDVLIGVERSSTTGFGGEEVRFGAAIPSAEVDANAFTAIGANAAQNWSYIIHEEVSVEDFLADFCLATSSYWYVDASGVLKVRKLAEARQVSSATVDNSAIVAEPTIEVAEDRIFPRAKIELGWDPFTKSYRDSVTVVDVEMASRYPEREDVLELSSRSLCLSTNDANRPITSRNDLEMILRRPMVEDGRGRLFLSVQATLALVTLDLGDIVTLDLDLPDLAGGTLIDRKARVISRRPDLDRGVVELRFQVLETLFHVAPACAVASINTASKTIVLAVGPEASSSSPCNMFGPGMFVDLVDITTGAIDYNYEVASVGATTNVVLTTTPFYTAGNDYYLRVAAQGTNSGTPSVNGFGGEEFVYQGPGTDTRWR